MPAIRRQIAAATENALTGLRFSRPRRPTLVSLWASTATADETCTFGVDDLILLETAAVNIEIAADIVDVARDQLLFREPCPPGEYVLAVPAVTAEFQFLLNQEVAA